jgi:hypothetical protein
MSFQAAEIIPVQRSDRLMTQNSEEELIVPIHEIGIRQVYPQILSYPVPSQLLAACIAMKFGLQEMTIEIDLPVLADLVDVEFQRRTEFGFDQGKTGDETVFLEVAMTFFPKDHIHQ